MSTPPHPASEMRRSANALLATRTQEFESPRDEASSRGRLAKAMESFGKLRFTVYTGAWKDAEGVPIFEATFAPAARVRIFIQALALAIFVLVAASAWVLFSPGESAALKFALPMSTVLAMFAMPLMVNAISSQREAEESRIARAIRAALRDEGAAYPPQQRWADED